MPLPSTMLPLIKEIAFVILLFFVLLALKLWIESLFKSSKKPLGYTLNPSLVSPAERSFLGCLDSVLPPEIRVFTKVRLADLFSVEKTTNRSARQSALNRIQSKHIDFVLCRSDDLAPLAAIELDDKSHEKLDRRERDEFLNALFAASPIQLLRIPAQRSYDTTALAQKLNEAMQPPAA